jgi:hypothetical protein
LSYYSFAAKFLEAAKLRQTTLIAKAPSPMSFQQIVNDRNGYQNPMHTLESEIAQNQ